MRLFLSFGLLLFFVFSCKKNINTSHSLQDTHIRHIEDTIGFAQYSWQLDSIIARMDPLDKVPTAATYKAVICPHDDYGYAGGLYFKTLSGVKAKTIVLIGVAHRAKNFDLQDNIIFGSYDSWQAPSGLIKVSPLRDLLVSKLNDETYIVHDSMMQLEHSLEAITPFLQRQNPEIEILSMLVPYNSLSDMQRFSANIAEELAIIMEEKNLKFGEDLAIVISNDAIHYGSEGWGGGNLAPFGIDSLGTSKAKQKDLDIINTTLKGELTIDKIALFNHITIMDDDYKAYKWTWCGRYATPFGLLLATKLSHLSNGANLEGIFIDWQSSIHHTPIKVDDLNMGHTAKADSTHWVAYVGMGYK